MVGAAVLAGACQTDREVTEPDPIPVTDSLLEDALLTDADVPAPYVVDEGSEYVGPELVGDDCDDGLRAVEPESTQQVVFKGSGINTTLVHTISYYPGNGGSVEQAYRDLLDDCAQVVVADGVRFTTTPLDFGVLSDDTFPIVMTIERTDGTIEERNLILMRQGDLISTIQLNSPRPSDKVLLDTVTRVAIGNLGELAQQTT
jgi:hypothetical protein